MGIEVDQTAVVTQAGMALYVQETFLAFETKSIKLDQRYQRLMLSAHHFHLGWGTETSRGSEGHGWTDIRDGPARRSIRR